MVARLRQNTSLAGLGDLGVEGALALKAAGAALLAVIFPLLLALLGVGFGNVILLGLFGAAIGFMLPDVFIAGKGKKRVWHSNRTAGALKDPPKDPAKTSGRPQSQREFKAQLKALAAARTKPASKSAPRAKPAKKSAAKPRSQAKPAAAKVERKSGRGVGDGKARLPAFIPPSLAMLHDDAPSGKNWLHEIKFDGYRMICRRDGGRVRHSLPICN